MSNVMRHRYGAKNPVLAEVASAVVIEVGDLCRLDTNKVENIAESASSYIAASVADDFLGVAMQASASGETTPIRIATSGTFEYPQAAAASCYLGYGVKPTASTNWVDQVVACVPAGITASCIGYAQPSGTGGVGGSIENVLVTIMSAALGPNIDS